MPEHEELLERIANDFAYHPADEATGSLHQSIRDALFITGVFLVEICPAGRELSLALTKLEEAMFWANGAIARTEVPAKDEISDLASVLTEGAEIAKELFKEVDP